MCNVYKIVAIESVSLISSAEQKLHDYAKEVVLFDDVPKEDAEIIHRIGDADAVRHGDGSCDIIECVIRTVPLALLWLRIEQKEAKR